MRQAPFDLYLTAAREIGLEKPLNLENFVLQKLSFFR